MFEVSRIRRTVGVGRATVALARSEQITFLAAAIAYYAFASIVPLVVLTAVVASVVGGEAFARDLVAFLGETLTPASQDVLLDTLTTTTGRGSATAIGVIALLWSSLKVFRALDTAFSVVYGHEEPTGFVDAVVDGAVALGAVAVAIGASVAVVAVLALVEVPYLARLGFALEVFVLTAAFYPLYYLFPDVEVGWVEAVPGALLAAFGWTALSGLFRLYAANAGTFALWGVLGVALVVVTWLYVGSLLLLVGAATNAVLAGRTLTDVEPDVSAAVDRHLQSARHRQVEPTMGDDDRDERGGGGAGADASEDAAADAGDDVGAGGTVDATTDDVEATGAGVDAGTDESAGASAADGAPGGGARDDAAGAPGDEPDPDELREEIAELRERLAEFEADVDDRTVHRDEVERDLKKYVRRKLRRGKARGWGPYLVLLYGTAMTVAAFYSPFLGGGWAIFAMIVVWLSTLGLYVLMVLVGLGLNVLSVPGRLRDAISDWRS